MVRPASMALGDMSMCAGFSAMSGHMAAKPSPQCSKNWPPNEATASQ